MKRVIIAMSGGVDSSVAAALLKKQNFDVIGVFFKLWKEPDLCNINQFENKCCSEESAQNARLVAQKLKIPLYTINYEKQFKKSVVDYFLAEYKAGRTPNPCVVCNEKIKFGEFFKALEKYNADFITTGHYCRLRRKSEIRNSKSETNLKSQIQNPNIYQLLEAEDKSKDQSYFLWKIKQEQLSKILFPIGEYEKTKVRKMAEKMGLPTASRPDSQEICFINGTVNNFLKKYFKTKTGNILNMKNKIIGEHEGAQFYTIGQRKGLPALLNQTPNTNPQYIIKTDIKKNLIWLGIEKDLYQKKLIATEINWLDKDFENQIQAGKTIKCSARIRYHHPREKVEVRRLKDEENKLQIEFKKPQRAITPGQSIVLYQGEQILGGGIIK